MSTRPQIFISLAILLILSCNAISDIQGEGDPLVEYGIDPENSLVLTGGQPRTLDPATTRSGASGPIGAIFSGLVTLDADLQVRPELAAGWSLNEDGTLYTFYLRPDASFHDGRPLTAADIIFSWERAAHSDTGSDTAQTYLGDIVGLGQLAAGEAGHIDGLRAIDDHTLEVRIDAPKVYFLSKLTYPVAFIVDRFNVQQSDWEHSPNGSGPFVLQEWLDDEILVLARNEAYYGTAPALEQVIYLIGAGIPLTMYEKDQIDLVGVGGATLERVQDPNNPLFPDLRLGVNMCTTTIGFDHRQPPFDDPLVRRAFSAALDRDRLISGLFKGNALPALGPLPPGMPGYTGDLEAYTYDPGRARELLAQAGFPDPASFPAVTYTTSGYMGVSTFVTAVSTMWQETLGVTVEPVLVDPFNYFDELYAGNTGQLFNTGWCADYPDPENFLDILYHGNSRQNLGGYHNPDVDALLESARVEPNIPTRLARYAQIERLIVDDAPAVFITHNLSAVLVKPHLQNYTLTPIGIPQWGRVSIER